MVCNIDGTRSSWQTKKGLRQGARLPLVSFFVVLILLRCVKQNLRIGTAQGLQPIGNKPDELYCPQLPQVGIVGFALGIVGVKVGGKNHIQLPAGRLAQTLHQLGAGGGKVNQRQTLTRCQRAHRVRVGTMGRGQGISLKMTANQRCN